MQLSLARQRSAIKQTMSLCHLPHPNCCGGYESDGKVYLHKTCPDHGDFDVLIIRTGGCTTNHAGRMRVPDQAGSLE